jgi:hypothetical protein
MSTISLVSHSDFAVHRTNAPTDTSTFPSIREPPEFCKPLTGYEAATVLPSSLDPIRSFLVVARELHFSRAAQTLHLSQPTVTQHIRRLESDLGVPLFSRHSRRVELTVAGRRFAARMTDLMVAMDHAAAELTQAGARHAPLRLACTPMAGGLREPLRAAAGHACALAVIGEG